MAKLPQKDFKIEVDLCSTVNPVYKGHTREPDNLAFMGSCHLYTGYNHMHHSFNGENEIVLYRKWFAI